MPVLRTYQCPDCDGVFEHLHMRVVEEPPAFCPLCGSSTSAEAQLSAPHIAKSIGKVADGVYRQMSDGAEVRAAAAAEMMGVDPSEMSAMKMTNMRDDVRVGETSVVSAPTPVSAALDQRRSVTPVGLQDAKAVSQFVADTRKGAYSGAGSQILDKVKANHAREIPRVIAAGKV